MEEKFQNELQCFHDLNAIDGSWQLTLYSSCPVNYENGKECRIAAITVALGFPFSLPSSLRS